MHIGDAPRFPAGGFSATEVKAHLERILASEAFKSSRRSQEFLRYVVGRVLAGQEESIKERTIAVEVFGRPAHYDSSEDSFVRVKASEVRRRLSHYAESHAAGDRLRIELPLGSYVPRFVATETAGETPTEAAQSVEPRRWRFMLAAALLAVLAAGWLTARTFGRTPMDRFWAPILRSPEPMLIFIPMPSSFSMAGEVEALKSPGPVHEMLSQGGGRRFAVPALDKVGLGAAQGAIRFAVLCAKTKKPYIIKAGDDFSFADLRNQPCVLFGAFSSKWTVEMNNDFRFRLIQLPDGPMILDSRNPGRGWTMVESEMRVRPHEDYAIAARIFESKSGQIVLIASGLSTFGTQAAAEFLTDPQRIAELARRSPRPLDEGNFQVVLHTKVIGNTPSPPKVIDVHFW